MSAYTSKSSPAPGILQGWLLIVGGLGMALVLWLAPDASASSRNGRSLAKHDFNSLVAAISGRYRMHAKPVPMMWVANLCANWVTKGSVSDMKVAEFEDADRIAKESTPAELGELVRSQLGDRWSPMVRDHDKSGADSFVYVQNGTDADLMRLIVVDRDGSELEVVGISLRPEQLAKWMNDHDTAHNKTPEAGD